MSKSVIILLAVVLAAVVVCNAGVVDLLESQQDQLAAASVPDNFGILTQVDSGIDQYQENGLSRQKRQFGFGGGYGGYGRGGYGGYGRGFGGGYGGGYGRRYGGYGGYGGGYRGFYG